jgi:hypothetical protein
MSFGGAVPAVSQLRFVVGVFYVLGVANLVITLVLVMLGGTPRLGLVLAGVGYIFTAWQLSRGSAVAHVVLAILCILSIPWGVLAGLVARQDSPFLAFLAFLASALMAATAYLLLFSRQLKSERKARRLLNIGADKRAFEASISEN